MNYGTLMRIAAEDIKHKRQHYICNALADAAYREGDKAFFRGWRKTVVPLTEWIEQQCRGGTIGTLVAYHQGKQWDSSSLEGTKASWMGDDIRRLRLTFMSYFAHTHGNRDDTRYLPMWDEHLIRLCKEFKSPYLV